VRTQESKELRASVLNDEMFCVSIIDWKGQLKADQILSEFLKALREASAEPDVWLSSTRVGRELRGKRAVLDEVSSDPAGVYELTIRRTRREVQGTWIASCLFYDANNPNEPTKGLSCLQFAVPMRLVTESNAIARSFALLVDEQASFGYGYAFKAPYSLNLETYGPGLASSGVLAVGQEDPYAWQTSLCSTLSQGTRPHQRGMLRFVYPLNFLGPELLDSRVHEESLASWIAANPSRGILSKIGRNLWEWSISEEEISEIRQQLGMLGKLIAYKAPQSREKPRLP
jgi:hypothetical protein